MRYIHPKPHATSEVSGKTVASSQLRSLYASFHLLYSRRSLCPLILYCNTLD